MSPIDYNAREAASGRFTGDMLTELIRQWQGQSGLHVDGYCGPNTQDSLRAQLGGESPASSPLGLAALAVAIEQIGKGEEGGNNSGAFVEMLHGKEYDGHDDDDGAWCAAFVSWCFERACAARVPEKMPFRRSGVAKVLWRRVGAAGSFPVAPAPGDVVCWDRGKRGSWQGHVGFVERVEGGILHTVEGNVGSFPSRVRRFTHDLTMQRRLEGFARPRR